MSLFSRRRRSDSNPGGLSPEFLGQWNIVADFTDLVPSDKLRKTTRQDHYSYEYRNAGGPAVASTGYGLVAAVLAEETDGILASWDCAFDEEHEGETPEQFLAWWGDNQVDFYGEERFLAARIWD